jgi:hypothetical protein
MIFMQKHALEIYPLVRNVEAGDLFNDFLVIPQLFHHFTRFFFIIIILRDLDSFCSSNSKGHTISSLLSSSFRPPFK